MLLLWLVLQLLTLGLAAGRVPLSAHFPVPIERQATAEVLIVQIVAASLLFPALLKDWRQWGWAVVTSWPMLKLASLFGGEAFDRVALAGGYLTIWLTTLTLWRSLLADERWQMISVAVASFWAIGGPILLYLHAEFSGGGGGWIDFGPVGAALDRLWQGRIVGMADIPLAVLLSAGIMLAILKNFRAGPIANKLSTDC